MYTSFIQGISDAFSSIESSIPERYRVVMSLLLYTLFIVIYSFFIWKFYRFIAKREIIKLNLSQYNHSNYPKLEKFLETLLNIIEYLIILPFLVFFWFTVFSIFLLVLSKGQTTFEILLISTAVITSSRIIAYLSEDLSRDVAKIFPFTILALFLLDPSFFDANTLFEKIIQIPELLNHILIFIVFIFFVEFFLRVVYSLANFFYASDEGEK